MTIDEYIQMNKYSSNAKKGGINYLLDKWKSRVDRIPFNSRYLFDDWINDLWTRAAIEKIFLNCEIPDNIRQRLETIDKQYKQKTISLSEIGKDDFIFKKEWDKKNYWFSYRIPPERVNDWIGYYTESVYFNNSDET